jgi:hypothetical protein
LFPRSGQYCWAREAVCLRAVHATDRARSRHEHDPQHAASSPCPRPRPSPCSTSADTSSVRSGLYRLLALSPALALLLILPLAVLAYGARGTAAFFLVWLGEFKFLLALGHGLLDHWRSHTQASCTRSSSTTSCSAHRRGSSHSSSRCTAHPCAPIGGAHGGRSLTQWPCHLSWRTWPVLRSGCSSRCCTEAGWTTTTSRR